MFPFRVPLLLYSSFLIISPFLFMMADDPVFALLAILLLVSIDLILA